MLEGDIQIDRLKLISHSNGIQDEPVGLIFTGFGFAGRPEHNSALAVHKRHDVAGTGLSCEHAGCAPGQDGIRAFRSFGSWGHGVIARCGSLSWVYFDAERKVK